MSLPDGFETALPLVGTDAAILNDPRIAHVVADGHTIVSRRSIPGLRLLLEETAKTLVGHLLIEEGTTLAQPVHLCFGLSGRTGVQRITIRVTVERGASATLLAHCLFPAAETASHLMDAVICVDEGARLAYREGHYHGRQGGIVVQPRLAVTVKKGGRYSADFSLLSGLVGSLAVESLVEVGDDALAELTAKVYGRHTDAIQLKDSIQLLGERAAGLIKTRVVVTEQATAEVTGITEAYGKGARGHIDCKEIVKDAARASAVPLVKVCHPQANVTHEAAIGSVDRKELETLMARGLTPDEAIDMIVGGILR